MFLANAFTDLFCAYSKFSVKLSEGWRNLWGQGGSARPLDFGRQINPISTRGGRLCPHINTGPPIFRLSYGPAKWLTEPCIRNWNATEVIRLIYVQLWKEYKLQNLLRKSRQIAKVLSVDAMLALHGWQCTMQASLQLLSSRGNLNPAWGAIHI